jgi:hypothetical protein
MDNNDEDCSVERGGSHPHVHWNDLLPYPVPSGTGHFEAVLAEMREALGKVDVFHLIVCANKFDQYKTTDLGPPLHTL